MIDDEYDEDQKLKKKIKNKMMRESTLINNANQRQNNKSPLSPTRKNKPKEQSSLILREKMVS